MLTGVGLNPHLLMRGCDHRLKGDKVGRVLCAFFVNPQTLSISSQHKLNPL